MYDNPRNFSTLDRFPYCNSLGLFETSHMSYELDRRKKTSSTEPSLEEMTVKAVEFLSKNTDGYFLLIEGTVNEFE